MKKIITVGSDEDGFTFYCVGNVSELGALRAIRKFQKDECEFSNKELATLPLTEANFWYTDRGEYEGWYWWGNPPRDAKPVGRGWIFRI